MNSRKVQVLALSAGQITRQIIGLSVAMIMTRTMLKEEFAAYRQTLLAYSSAAPFFGLGIAQSIYYFLPKEEGRIRGRIIENALILFLSGLLLSAFIVLGGNEVLANRFQNPQVAHMVLWMAPCALVALPASLTSCVLVARGEALKSAVISVSSQLGIGLCTLAALLMFSSAQAALAGFVIGTVISGSVAFYLMINMMPKDSTALSRPDIFITLKFAVPLGLSFMVGHLAMQMGGLMISLTASPAAFAIFSVASQELPLQIITSSITSVILADMAMHFSKGEAARASELWKTATSKSCLLLIPAFVFLMAFADDYITLLFSREYAASIPIFQIFLLLIPLRAFYFGSILVAAGESRFILVRTIAWAVITVALGIAVFDGGGIAGVAWVIVLTQYFFAAPLNFHRIIKVTQQRLTDLIPINDIGKICVASTLPLIVAIPARSLAPSYAGITLAAAAYGTALAAGFVSFGFLSPVAIGTFLRQRIRGEAG